MAENQTQTPAPQWTEGNAQTGGEQGTPRMFTQDDLDRILAERLARQKAQFADYDSLKEAAAKWNETQEKQKTEAERQAERLAALERERDEALLQANDRLIKSAFLAEGARAGVLHPGDVYALADLSNINVNDDGDVVGVAEAVEAVVKAGRVPMSTNKPQAPNMDGGAGSKSRAAVDKDTLTSDELHAAQRLGITPEKYVERKKEREKALKGG